MAALPAGVSHISLDGHSVAPHRALARLLGLTLAALKLSSAVPHAWCAICANNTA